MTDRPTRRAIDRVHAKLPTIECKGLCAESCGPIAQPDMMGRAEWDRIVATVAHEPVQDGIDCALLDGERCSVYAVRPTICRLWGMVESMECPWGCKPTRYLTREEGFVVLRAIDRIGQ